ncbi:MAG: elongator complex protein 3 [Vicinamibacteria bacterium]
MRRTRWQDYRFAPEEHEEALLAIIRTIEARPEIEHLDRVLRRYPKNGTSLFSKSELIAGYRHLAARHALADPRRFFEKVRMKPVRSLSGVTPVTVLTKPFPCPGKCIFCPNDVTMPKSYLANEPGAQRAGMHRFDPYEQTLSRVSALYWIGHPVDKVELIVLGGTWSFYPEPYQIWFLTRVFEALNDFGRGRSEGRGAAPIDFAEIEEVVDGRRGAADYNRIVTEFLRKRDPEGGIERGESATWNDLIAAQRENETAGARAVGLSLETRPDHVDEGEVARLRRLGATKIQIGYQSLDDEVLRLNQRGHDVAASRRATKLLRRGGFKIQAHWMANLYGATPERDVVDYERLFSDPDFRPDELKLYPTSLVESATLMEHYEAGRYRPYSEDELLELLIACIAKTPSYCRLSRVIRDIPGEDILVGSRVTNFRAVAEEEMRRRGIRSRDIRAREIRGGEVALDRLRLECLPYRTSAGKELFLSFVADAERLAGFLRLSLPASESFIDELADSAVIREVHVYGSALGIGERDDGKAQHLGLGRKLIDRAALDARSRGFKNLSVISSVGTREYYRRLGFTDGALYQHRAT